MTVAAFSSCTNAPYPVVKYMVYEKNNTGNILFTLDDDEEVIPSSSLGLPFLTMVALIYFSKLGKYVIMWLDIYGTQLKMRRASRLTLMVTNQTFSKEDLYALDKWVEKINSKYPIIGKKKSTKHTYLSFALLLLSITISSHKSRIESI